MSAEMTSPEDPPCLVPKLAPGRQTRKARSFGAEIARLHALGHTLQAIQEALAEVGVTVSKSTVQREAARHRRAAVSRWSPVTSASGPAQPSADPPPPARLAIADVPAAADDEGSPTVRRSKALAEAFVRSQITNPLARAKESS